MERLGWLVANSRSTTGVVVVVVVVNERDAVLEKAGEGLAWVRIAAPFQEE